MNQPLSPAAFHRQYDETLSAFCRQAPDSFSRLLVREEADPFLRQCALGVWQAGGQTITPTHVEYYNAIYQRGNTPASTLFWELTGQTANYPGFSAPDWYRRLCRHDREIGANTAQRFLETFSLLLLLFASIDGQVDPQEATFVQACNTAMADVWGDGPPAVPLPDLTPFLPAGQTNADQTAKTQTDSASVDASSPEEPAPTLEELLVQLDELCGLKTVKADVHSLINLVKVRKLREAAALPVPPMSLHMVFMGNPGTGKTTVARLLAQIYKAMGVLPQGQLVEVDRSGLVAGFVGQTALKTAEALEKAIGGVLFIDEAYALTPGDSPNDFGREAIEVLLKGMEDHRKDLIVIVAGYTHLMGQFIASNPGLESRFNKYLTFDDYTGEELLAIFHSLCQKNGYTLPPETQSAAETLFDRLFQQRDENFGNAREVRNTFEKAVSRQADRVAAMEAPTRDDLMSLLPQDLQDPEKSC